MTRLSSKQRAFLRRLAHGSRPLVLIGTEGVTEAVVTSVEDALRTRELVKIKLQEAAPTDARAASDEICARIAGAHPVQTIGRTAVLYRPHPETPEIRLPSRGA